MAGPFLLEIRRGTQSALLLVREASLRSLPADISLAPARLELRSAGACGALELPPGVSLAPGSCRGLRRLPGEGLHLRLRLRAAPGGAELVYNLRESLKPQKNCIFYCQSCGDVIVKERKFLRVLPLPSENWSALVEEWCCHPNPFAKSTLHPQRDDCFLGDTFLLLNSGNESHVPEPPICFSETGHHASQNGSTLKSKENTRVFCKRCKTMLGETISSDTIKYYVTEVIVQPSEGSFKTIPRSQFVQSMVAQCLMELSSAKSTFRFTIKGDDGKIYILIWVLNSDTLLVESLGSSSSHNVFTLFGDTFMPNSGPVGTWNAVKVLYQPCIKSRNKDDPNRFYGVICTPGDSSTVITGVLLWILILLVFLGKAKLCSVSLKTALLGMTLGIYLTWMPLSPMLQLGLLSSYWYVCAHCSSHGGISEGQQMACVIPPALLRACGRTLWTTTLADAWENDFGVHPLKFPSETCLELLLILGLSTTSLPPSLQCMNSFQVAFLKM